MTSYDIIFTPFQEKIVQDMDFFIYDGLDDTQTKEIITRRCTNYLNKSVMEFKAKSRSNVDFDNRDKDLKTFNFELHNDEIDIFVDLMFIEHMSQDIARLKMISPYFSESEITRVFSPASERKSYLEMINTLKKEVEQKIKTYNGRDRETGKIKLPNYDVTKIGANYVN